MSIREKISHKEEVFKILDGANFYNLNMKKNIRTGKKIFPYEHLDYILKNTTPYQRMLWLKRALEFWKIFKKKQELSLSKKRAT